MSKRRSWAQRVGAEGEAAFRLYGVRNGLLPNKVEEDVGIDFFCQIEGAREGQKSALIVPKVVGVNVRSTREKRHPRVRLDRSDAEGMLQADFPAFVSLVHLTGGAGTIYHRFVDEEFAVELADFLAGEKDWFYLTPRQCRDEGSFARDLAAALDGNAAERVRVALAERGLSQYVPDATVEVRRNREGELTLVQVGNFYDLFMRTKEPTRDSVYGAIFGAPEKRVERLLELGPRPELAEALKRLPPSAQYVGATSESTTALIAGGTDFGSARLVVERLDTATHYGWVHPTGFSITVSRPVLRGGVYVHELDAGVDVEEKQRLVDVPDLWLFLEACGLGSEVTVDGHDRLALATNQITDLGRFHAYAAWLRMAGDLPGWDAVREHLGLALHDESLHTLAWCAELARNANVLQRFGFEIQGDEVEPVERRLEMPVVGNLGDQSIVTWLTVDCSTFESDGQFRGLRIESVLSVRVEVGEPVDKAADWPELITGGDWPAVLISPEGYAQTETDATGFGLEIRPL